MHEPDTSSSTSSSTPASTASITESAAEAATRYATGADARDVGMFLSAFAPDAVLEVFGPGSDTPRSTYTGHEDLARIPPVLDRYVHTRHDIGPLEGARVDGDAMTARVRCTAHHVGDAPDGPIDTVMTIVYHDTYRPVDGRWLIARREVRMSAVETVPVDRPPDPGATAGDRR